MSIDLADVIINELAARSLNHFPDPEWDENPTAEAIYSLSQNVRRGSLAIYIGLVAVANAIKEERDAPERISPSG